MEYDSKATYDPKHLGAEGLPLKGNHRWPPAFAECSKYLMCASAYAAEGKLGDALERVCPNRLKAGTDGLVLKIVYLMTRTPSVIRAH